MAALVIEEEVGTSSAWAHPHNGYHAGRLPGPQESTADSHGVGRAARELATRLAATGGPAVHLW